MQIDIDFLGLAVHGDGRFDFVVDEHLARLDGRLYGGSAIAVSIATAELVSERRSLWMTTQFVSTVERGTRVDVHTEVLAPGRRTNQVRVTGTGPGGAVVFASLGATGHHREGGLSGTFETMPTVSSPDESSKWDNPFSGMAEAAGIEMPPMPFPKKSAFSSVIEMRNATVLDHPDAGPGRICVWVRRRDQGPITPALASYMADMVPMSVAHACKTIAGGTSLDNSMRIGDFEGTEWILLDLRPHIAAGDYGHGSAHIWNQHGNLVATASQTASMMQFDLTDPPWKPAS